MEFDDSDKLDVGDLVLAIGDPFGVGQTVTQGIISALARTEEGISHYGFFIQNGCSDQSRQFSGGALVDMRGRLIGINSAIVSQTRELGRHRLRDTLRHGEGRCRDGKKRPHRGSAAVARRGACKTSPRISPIPSISTARSARSSPT